jgi:hypothetical protein
MKFVALILLLFLPSIAGAWDEPSGFKDYRFGMTKPEVDAIAKQRWGHVGPREKIGDIDVMPFFYYERDAQGIERLGEVTFLFNRRSEFDLIKAVFLERYGKPTSATFATYRNGFGAQFKGEILEWRGERSVIRIDEIATDKYGNVKISTLSRERERPRRNPTKGSKKPQRIFSLQPGFPPARE